MLMTLNEFVNKYNGKYVEYNNDAYKFQCVDLMLTSNKIINDN